MVEPRPGRVVEQKKQRKAKEKSKNDATLQRGGKTKKPGPLRVTSVGAKTQNHCREGEEMGGGSRGGGEGSELARESEGEIGWVSEWLE